MTFKKFTKEEWFKLSQVEQDFHTLEFKELVEKRIKINLIVTKSLVIVLLAVLIMIGFVQLKAVNNYGAIKEQYGKNAFCYLCGLESYKKCECQYLSGAEGVNDFVLEDLEEFRNSLAEYNIKQCKTFAVQDGTYHYAGFIDEINIS